MHNSDNQRMITVAKPKFARLQFSNGDPVDEKLRPLISRYRLLIGLWIRTITTPSKHVLSRRPFCVRENENYAKTIYETTPFEYDDFEECFWGQLKSETDIMCAIDRALRVNINSVYRVAKSPAVQQNAIQDAHAKTRRPRATHPIHQKHAPAAKTQMGPPRP
jgi:hypothetical protein